LQNSERKPGDGQHLAGIYGLSQTQNSSIAACFPNSKAFQGGHSQRNMDNTLKHRSLKSSKQILSFFGNKVDRTASRGKINQLRGKFALSFKNECGKSLEYYKN